MPEQLTNRLLLEQTPGTAVIFLDAPFPTLYDRCMIQSIESPTQIRPNLASPAQAQVRFAARQPLYRRLARLTIPTADLTPAETAHTLLTSLATLPTVLSLAAVLRPSSRIRFESAGLQSRRTLHRFTRASGTNIRTVSRFRPIRYAFATSEPTPTWPKSRGSTPVPQNPASNRTSPRFKHLRMPL